MTTPAGLTNGHVIQAFNPASLQLGLGNWGLMGLAGLSLNALAANRNAAYTGPRLADMPKLSDEQRQLVRAQLPAGLAFAIPASEGLLLVQDEALLVASLAYPPALHIRKPQGAAALVAKAASAWNRYGFLLTQIADRMGVALDLVVAVLATSADPRGAGAVGRLRIRFDAALFYGRWGHENAARHAEHFRFDPMQPRLGQQWRPDAETPWRDIHEDQASEWGALELARSLDKPAAYEATEMGLARLLGAAPGLVGYESAAQMLDAFVSSERFQVLALFDLIGGPGAATREADALRDRDVETFATLYAGPSDAAQYAVQMREAAAAFRRLSPLG